MSAPLISFPPPSLLAGPGCIGHRRAHAALKDTHLLGLVPGRRPRLPAPLEVPGWGFRSAAPRRRRSSSWKPCCAAHRSRQRQQRRRGISVAGGRGRWDAGHRSPLPGIRPAQGVQVCAHLTSPLMVNWSPVWRSCDGLSEVVQGAPRRSSQMQTADMLPHLLPLPYLPPSLLPCVPAANLPPILFTYAGTLRQMLPSG